MLRKPILDFFLEIDNVCHNVTRVGIYGEIKPGSLGDPSSRHNTDTVCFIRVKRNEIDFFSSI